MRKLVVGTLGLFASCGLAVAADMPMPVKAPPPPPVADWTGLYIGANGGYSWGRADTEIAPGTPFPLGVKARVDGWLAGGQLGYNWQLNSRWLVGLEGDIQWTDEHDSLFVNLGSTRVPTPGGDFNVVTNFAASAAWKMPWFATFRGRVGLLATPDFLLYGTGGLAVADLKFSTQLITIAQLFGPGSLGTTPAGPPFVAVSPFFSENATRLGWTAGGGVEARLSPRWSIKLEYLYMDFGRHTYLAGTGFDTSIRYVDHVARVGLNFHFPPSAVVAKY